MPRRFDPSALYVFAFIGCLAIPQLGALGIQFARGYRPFGHQAERVPFSWDMFANRVERCTVEWTPALQIEKHRLTSLHGLDLPFEWDIALDSVETYRAVAGNLCRKAGAPSTRARLHCFLPDGTEMDDDAYCN